MGAVEAFVERVCLPLAQAWCVVLTVCELPALAWREVRGDTGRRR